MPYAHALLPFCISNQIISEDQRINKSALSWFVVFVVVRRGIGGLLLPVFAKHHDVVITSLKVPKNRTPFH